MKINAKEASNALFFSPIWDSKIKIQTGTGIQTPRPPNIIISLATNYKLVSIQ
jgi:hypothetical protein